MTTPRTGRGLGRYQSLAVVTVVLVAAVLMVVFDSHRDGAGDANQDAVGPAPVPTVHKGPHCDSATGRLAVPSFYAPPCVAPFHGDNGGATAPGVTGDAIRLVVYPPKPEFDLTDAVHDWTDYFQHYYETYARSIQVIPFTPTGTDAQSLQADAIRIADELHAFAVISGPASGDPTFAESLAGHGVMCLGCTGGQAMPADFYAQHAPYVWQPSTMDLTQSLGLRAEYIGKRLAGHPAGYAGEPALRQRTRRFAVVYPDFDATDSAVDEFASDLARYGVSLAARLQVGDDRDTVAAEAATLVAKLKAGGVTTVVLQTTGQEYLLLDEATKQGYFPEWLPAGGAGRLPVESSRLLDQRQWAHAFGPVQFGPSLPTGEAEATRVFEWYYGRPMTAQGSSVYDALNLLFTGIHLAGPDLTPAHFRDGLFALRPLGGTPAAPTLAYGRSPTDYSGPEDMTEAWWDPTAKGDDENGTSGTGMWRFVNGAERYSAGRWPRTPPRLFVPEGTITGFSRIPAKDRPPSYPKPGK